jgi:archaeal type IV pilus assembly protein PilA
MSIVISTVIIVAISITMAIAVAFWAMGIGNSLTRFEKIEFVSIYADNAAGTPNAYPIYLTLKNTGSATATINNVFLNGKPYNVPGILANVNFINQALQTGQTSPRYPSASSWVIRLPVGGTWNSGDYVEVEIETSAGRQYSSTVMLP